MARSSKHTIILSCDNVKRKCCKILFTGDGSFSITAPYHAAEKAILFKATFNYENNEQEVHLDETIDLSELDEGRLKITYHRSGFVQYSGDGVISGIDNNGVPKGLGLFTVPLEEATIGPLVIIAVENLNELEETRKTSKHDLIFDTSRLAPLPNQMV